MTLKARIDVKAAPETLARQYLDILWYVFKTEESGYEDFPSRLDSLFNCCLSGKTGKPDFEKRIMAENTFFKGVSAVWEEPDTAQNYLMKAIPLFSGIGDSSMVTLCFLELTIVASGQGTALPLRGIITTPMRCSAI
ncbi:MAG: hypothetical protein IPL92_04275 [Saprospiraceae bacterium]|nr:hypothetical protein [Candidatus Opimibacter iunctus]